MAVWNRCNVDKKGLDHTCLANDFKKKLTDKVEDEVTRMGRNPETRTLTQTRTLTTDHDSDPDPDSEPYPNPDLATQLMIVWCLPGYRSSGWASAHTRASRTWVRASASTASTRRASMR